MLESFMFYIEYYSHASNTILTILFASFIAILFRIFFVRYNFSWKEYDYPIIPALLIIPAAVITTPIIDMLSKLHKHPGVNEILLNIDNNNLINLITYGGISVIAIALMLFAIQKPWWSIQNENNYVKYDFIRILALNIITLLIADTFMNSQMYNHPTTATNCTITIVQIIVLFIYNMYLYRKFKNPQIQING